MTWRGHIICTWVLPRFIALAILIAAMSAVDEEICVAEVASPAPPTVSVCVDTPLPAAFGYSKTMVSSSARAAVPASITANGRTH